MSRLHSRTFRRALTAGAALGALVFAAILCAQRAGWLQRLECSLYDAFIRRLETPAAVEERIVVCGITEEDLIRFGHPLSDSTMARLLENLALAKPAVIGLDIYRDLPEPRTGEQYPELERVFQKYENIIAIERLGKIKGPPSLEKTPERIAPNNLPRDYTIDDTFRRAPLFFEAGLPEARPSFAMAVAAEFFSRKNVEVQLTEPATEGEPPLLKIAQTVFPRLHGRAGGYANVKVQDYEILADYRVSRASCFAQISVADVLDNPPLGDDLEGKVVLVATVMESVKDNNNSPVDSNHRGVFQHAGLINQLLRAALENEKPLGWLPPAAVSAWIALATALGCVVGGFSASPWRLIPLLASGLGGIFWVGWSAFQARLWLPTVAPGLAFLGAASLLTSLLVFLERKQFGAMRSMFSKHVSPSVVDTLWKAQENFMQGGRVLPKRLVSTVFFTDLKNFSTTSEGMEPAALLDWMNEYLEGLSPKVELAGGMVNKYIGDAIMAVFGAPMERTTEPEIDRDAANAVQCALAMRAEIKRLNADWLKRGLPTASMRVGIHTGPVISGCMGSRSRMEFTVLGDVVNTAARLESAGKEAPRDAVDPDCTILISESTFLRLHGKFPARHLGPMALKGKGEKVVVYSVL